MSMYNTPERISYSFNAVSFAANSARYLRGPAGKIGVVKEVQSAATTSFVGTTSAGRVQVGDGVTATKYVDLALGAAGAGPAAGTVTRATDVTKVGSGAALKGQDPNALPFAYVPDAVATVNFIAPVGTPAGVADVTIVVDWFEA